VFLAAPFCAAVAFLKALRIGVRKQGWLVMTMYALIFVLAAVFFLVVMGDGTRQSK